MNLIIDLFIALIVFPLIFLLVVELFFALFIFVRYCLFSKKTIKRFLL